MRDPLKRVNFTLKLACPSLSASFVVAPTTSMPDDPNWPQFGEGILPTNTEIFIGAASDPSQRAILPAAGAVRGLDREWIPAVKFEGLGLIELRIRRYGPEARITLERLDDQTVHQRLQGLASVMNNKLQDLPDFSEEDHNGFRITLSDAAEYNRINWPARGALVAHYCFPDRKSKFSMYDLPIKKVFSVEGERGAQALKSDYSERFPDGGQLEKLTRNQLNASFAPRHVDFAKLMALAGMLYHGSLPRRSDPFAPGYGGFLFSGRMNVIIDSTPFNCKESRGVICDHTGIRSDKNQSFRPSRDVGAVGFPHLDRR